MAMVAKVLMVVLAFGCATVMNQSTTRDHDDKSLIRIVPHLEMLITKLEGKMMLEMAGLEQRLISRFRQLRGVAECSMEVLSYSAYGVSCTPDIGGYVKLNGTIVWRSSWCGEYPSYRGTNTFLIDPFECSVQELRQFDTYASSGATELSNYLQLLNHGVILAGVSADEPTRQLTSALPALQQLGANVSDVQNRGSFAFVAQKSFPRKTFLRKAITEAESHTQPAGFDAIITGTLVDDLTITIT